MHNNDILRFKLLSGGRIAIVGVIGKVEELIVPDEIDGKKVTQIGSQAFEDCSSLTSIIIPEGVTNIKEGAFSGCSSLTNVVVPEGVTEIAESVFGLGAEELTICGVAGSYAESYAKENNLRFVADGVATS